MNRSIILPALVTAFVALSPAGVALADNPHDPAPPANRTTGQPNKRRQERRQLEPPGFSTDGFANAEAALRRTAARATDLATNTANAHAVSQYDVAGFQLLHPPWEPATTLLRRAYALTRPGQSRCVPRSAPRPARSA